jgi:glyoxylase-like metal-dependent hydrolase (beta-lactamase superfamily II)
MNPPEIESFYHEPTFSWSHLVVDAPSGRAALIDPVLDFDAASGRTSRAFADRLIGAVRAKGARLEWILETHAHADHLSAAPVIQAALGGQICIGEGIRAVQRRFRDVFHLGDDFATDGSQFDELVADGDELSLGETRIRVMATPGHTSDSVTYVVLGAAFIGDTLFSPDYGSARCDFPGGDAGLLYDSVQKLYRLRDGTRLYLAHDYPPPEREPQAWFDVDEQRRANKHLTKDTPKAAFVARRRERDATLSAPRLLLPSVQVNIRAGAMPPPEANGISYLKIPVDLI